jgi:hypothetical protein
MFVQPCLNNVFGRIFSVSESIYFLYYDSAFNLTFTDFIHYQPLNVTLQPYSGVDHLVLILVFILSVTVNMKLSLMERHQQQNEVICDICSVM